MSEHVFHCGLTREQREHLPEGTQLSFEKGVGNLNLKLDRMRKRLVGREPRRLTDFVEIASYVFAADRLTHRGELTDPGLGKDWRRRFRLIIAVRNPSFWQRPDVKGALKDALVFLSEDFWQLEFVDNLHPIPLQDYLGLKPEEVDDLGGTSIVLFSGGLDSLAGALYELNSTNRHVVLVSHRNLPTVGRRQRQLAERLASDFPKRVTHVWVDNSLTNKLEADDETQRTRTFFFTAMAAVAAHIDNSDRIRFYENGVMSINLPFVTQLVGSRTSRSTHPRSLQLMGRLVNLVAEHAIEIGNPFIWQTKTEIVRELAQSCQAELIQDTCSCSRSQYAMRTYKPHCGTCIQCLHRWISTMSGGGAEFDEGDGYETDLLEGPREDGRDRIMALGNISLALDCSSMSDRDFLGRFADPLAWVNQAFPNGEREDVAKRVISLFRRHGEAVKSIIAEAISNHATGLIEPTLPPSSLLALLLKERLSRADGPAARCIDPIKLPEPQPDNPTGADTVYIAVDEKRRSILISDRPELRGPTIFPLMKFLIDAWKRDRAEGRLRRNHRRFAGKVIAEALGLSDATAVSQAIRRARAELAKTAQDLGSFDGAPNAVIENTGRGYRLNPGLLVVSLEEYKKL